MARQFKPMLAVDFDERLLRFPYYASPKLDGIRCLVLEGQAVTRALKRIPNFYVREFFEKHAKLFDGLDGELVVGDPTAPNAIQNTTSGIMSHGGRPAFYYFAFDVLDPTGRRPYRDRLRELEDRAKDWPKNVGLLLQVPVENAKQLVRFEDGVLKAGYEGAMLRNPASYYKQGRATLAENSLLKVKRLLDAEAMVIGVEEQMHNTNPGYRNALGRTQRSTARSGLIGKGTLGALVVQGLPGQAFAGATFSIGTGFDDALRQVLWNRRHELHGLHVTYRYFGIGSKDAPRHPVFAGFREQGT
jgi:DNA ligase-1